MKIHYILILFTFILLSCDPDPEKEIENLLDSVETVTFSYIGRVSDRENKFGWEYGRTIHNASIKLMYEDLILDETNTESDGIFTFEEQLIPTENTFLLFEAPGHHTSVVKIDENINSNSNHILLDIDFSIGEGSAITGNEHYVNLQFNVPSIQNTFYPQRFYFTNDDNEVIGSARSTNQGAVISVPQNQEILLHIKSRCEGFHTIELGSFTEDADLGSIWNEDLVDDTFFFKLGSLNTMICDDIPMPNTNSMNYKILYKIGEKTTASFIDYTFEEYRCNLSNETLVTFLLDEPRLIHEQIIDFSNEQDYYIDFDEVLFCEEDDTHINFSINGEADKDGNHFTVANIYDNGKTYIKNRNWNLQGFPFRSFSLPSSSIGTYSGRYLMYGVIGTNFSDENAEITVTKNDGKFIEGTINAQLIDANENSAGTLVGSFKARIQ